MARSNRALEHTAFIPAGNKHSRSSRETAVLLVGTAEEFGISQDSIKMVPGGFRITEELADLLYDESNLEPSGRTAEQENSKEESL